MNLDLKILSGVWIQAAGTVLAALGATPSLPAGEQTKTNLSLIGNVKQAMGNALLADTEKTVNFIKIGEELQAAGNSTVVAGILLPVQEETKTTFIIQGNLLQSLGKLTALADLLPEEKSFSRLLHICASLLQAIGNSLQALSGKMGQNGQQTVNFAGSWIQATGAVLEALVQTRELSRKPPVQKNEHHSATANGAVFMPPEMHRQSDVYPPRGEIPSCGKPWFRRAGKEKRGQTFGAGRSSALAPFKPDSAVGSASSKTCRGHCAIR